MPTNEERSDVAARLRNYENLRESFRESPICAFLDALEVEYLDWKSICNLLADLIEPEPEHITTRHGKFKIRYGNKIPLCEYCGYSIGDKRYSYCPNCGAKITSGKDTDVINNIRSVKQMAEYIVNTDREEARWGLFGANYAEYLNNKVIEFMGNPVMERVVRCKDCKFFGKGEACVMFPMQTIRIIHPSKDGFCAWGERRCK